MTKEEKEAEYREHESKIRERRLLQDKEKRRIEEEQMQAIYKKGLVTSSAVATSKKEEFNFMMANEKRDRRFTVNQQRPPTAITPQFSQSKEQQALLGRRLTSRSQVQR